MIKRLLFYTISFLLMAQFAYAQKPLAHEKGAYIDSLNRYYQQAQLPLYIYVSNDPKKAPTQLADGDKSNEVNPVEPIYLDGHGKHILKHVDAIHHNEQHFVVYADGMAPKSQISLVNAPHYVQNGHHFYGKNLYVSLNASDEMSGVASIYQSINSGEYAKYTQGQPFQQEGDVELKFYAVDMVGNEESAQTNIFTVDHTPPSTFYNVVGIAQGNVISTATQLYLTADDGSSGVAQIFYRLDSGEFRPYTDGSNIPFQVLNDGEHRLTFYSVDQVKNKEEYKTFDFYLDKTAPIMSADVLGDKFVVGDKVYFSGRTKLKLTAVDNKSGIKDVFYSVDNQTFEKYNDPFYLPSVAGEHMIRYYALDNMANEGAGAKKTKYDQYRHTVSKVYVDLTGPVLGYKYAGEQFQKGDTVYINGTTRVQLSATDPESGLQYISYTIDGVGGEQKYEAPFALSQSGTHTIEYFGYDNVNNRNVSRIVVAVDNTAPEIFHQFSVKPLGVEDGVPVIPSYATIFLSSTDDQTGYEKITYQINGAPELLYLKPLQGWKKGEVYELKVVAIDKLGNKQETIIKFKTAAY